MFPAEQVVVTVTATSHALPVARRAARGGPLRRLVTAPAGTRQTWVFGPSGVEIRSDRGDVAFSWAAVTRMRVVGGALVVLFGENLPFVLDPATTLDVPTYERVCAWWVAARRDVGRGGAVPRPALVRDDVVTPTVVVPYRLERRVHAEALRDALLTRAVRVSLTLLGVAAATATVTAVPELAATGRLDPAPLALLAVLALLLGVVWFEPRRHARQLPEHPTTGQEMLVTAGSVTVVHRSLWSRIPWSMVRAVVVRRSTVLFRTRDRRPLGVPAAAFDDATPARVTGLALAAGADVVDDR